MNDDLFRREVIRSLETVTQETRFNRLFDLGPGGQPPVADEFLEPLDARRRADAIEILRRLRIDPDRTQDTDWARVSLGLLGGATRPQDVLAAVGYGLGSEVAPSSGGIDFPEFETDHLLGLSADKIRVIADLYYIHIFDRLGIFRVVDELARRTFDPAFDLGSSPAGLQLYTYLKRKRLRFPDEDRHHLLTQVFEGGAGGTGTFRSLMGRFVESLIDFARIRNAAELVSNTGNTTSIYTRSAVIRAAMNMQRFMSDAGGGILRYLRDETGAQLNECFQILSSPDVQRYWGGDFKSGLWAVVDGVIYDLDGTRPQSDRARTLAVHGRRAFYFLANNTTNIETLTDTDIDEVSEHIQNWIAAYRRPETEPSWLEEDDDLGEARDIGDEMAEEALRAANGGDYGDADVLD